MSIPPEDKGQEWGAGEASTPYTVKADIKPGSFLAEGHAGTVRDIYRRAGLYTLLGNIGMLVAAILMLGIAALVVVYAPPASVVSWIIAIPSVVLAFGLGGFAVFRIKATKAGWEVSGGPAPAPVRSSRGRQK